MATSDKEKDTSTDTKNKETEETAAESAKLVSNESSTNTTDGRIFEADNEVILNVEEQAEVEEFRLTLKKYNDLSRKMLKDALKKEREELDKAEQSPKMKYYEGSRMERIKVLEAESSWKMSFVVSGYDNNKSVKIICNEKLSNEELHRLLARYGDVEKIVSEEQHRIVYFSSPEEAKKCVEDSDNLQSLLSLYANVKAKSKDDFEKLTELLGNRNINGTKITTIPITKIPRPDADPAQ
ncbi:hypothetical protein V9T40_006534 [Parthenolecanium corni]|uniref:RRM domain-containing protein n=1 Tax=Parthenolecanium corni TaxID=536013 RepID=A0AAN9TZI8_9HEMI